MRAGRRIAPQAARTGDRMASHKEKLARSLEALKTLQDRGAVVIRSSELPRDHLKRLIFTRHLQMVMKGWYIPGRPDLPPDDRTAWDEHFWDFCTAYIPTRFKDDWCLSAGQSLHLHAGNRTVPHRLLLHVRTANSRLTALPFDTYISENWTTMPDDRDIEVQDGLRVYSPSAALIACPPSHFFQNATDMRDALTAVEDVSEVLRRLLEDNNVATAGRLAGAFRSIGRTGLADEIVEGMRAAGHEVLERDPFVFRADLTPTHHRSPLTKHVRSMWERMRPTVIERFPAAPENGDDIGARLRHVDDAYAGDAYHSLSIEGYKASPALVEQVRGDGWNPRTDNRGQRDALAARGHWQAFQAVRRSLGSVLHGESPGAVADRDHGVWYRELLEPGVRAGLIPRSDLAGYRSGPVFIRRSLHTPPDHGAVRAAMPTLFEMLAEEPEPSVRAVLGHFVLFHIHPYPDNNGCIGRFLMNIMLVAGGYPWAVVPLGRRSDYMQALGKASLELDIGPFAGLLAGLVSDGLTGSSARQLAR